MLQVCVLYGGDFIDSCLMVVLQVLHLQFELSLLFLEYEALAFEEVEFFRQFDAVCVSLDLDIDVSIGLLGKDQVVAHLLKDVGEGPQKVLFLP